MNRSPRGWVALWFLIVIAFFVAVASFPLSVPEGWEIALFIGAALVTAAGLMVEAKRDLWSVVAFGLFVGCTGAIVAGIVAVAAPGPAPVATVVSGVALALALTCAGILFRLYRRADAVPNVLAARFGKSSLLETDGVQLSLRAFSPNPPDQVGTIQAFLQNCFDAERNVSLQLEVNEWSARVLLEARSNARLGPLEVGVLTIPYRIQPGRASTVELVASVAVSGQRGRRIRRWRARSATRKVSPLLQLVAGLAGHLVWGGGIQVRIDLPDVPDASPPLPPPPPTWEKLWGPEGTTPLAAARTAGMVRGDASR